MANGRNKLRKGDAGRDSGGFVALPWAVLDCPAYGRLSHPARSLLLDIARQFVRDNNGRLLASLAFLKSRGWNSNDTLTRALRELLAAGFIHQTAQGHRPKRASWYAVTWRNLDRHPGYDAGAVEGFRRGAYRFSDPFPTAAIAPSHGAVKNAVLTPSHGAIEAPIAPSNGAKRVPIAPSGGAVEGVFSRSSAPSDGDHLEKPSTGSEAKEPRAVQCTAKSTARSSKTSGRPAAQNAVTDEPARQPTTVKRQARRQVPAAEPTAQLALL